MSEIFEIWSYFMLHGLDLDMTLEGLGNLFVIFSVDIWLWFSVTVTWMLKAGILFIQFEFSLQNLLTWFLSHASMSHVGSLALRKTAWYMYVNNQYIEIGISGIPPLFRYVNPAFFCSFQRGDN